MNANFENVRYVVIVYMNLFILSYRKKKVFTTSFACFENVDNITENNYILHHSLMEIEDL